MSDPPSQDEINTAQAHTNLVQATTNAEFRTDLQWIKRLQWWQMGLLVGQSGVIAIVASKLLGGPGAAEVAAVLVGLVS